MNQDLTFGSCGYEHYYPYDKRYQQVYDLCVEFKAPVMIHTGDTFLKQGKTRRIVHTQIFLKALVQYQNLIHMQMYAFSNFSN
ncbi:MAG: hypothetical protein WBZ36_01770 [Candidatus Nitrosopolaris sp.]